MQSRQLQMEQRNSGKDEAKNRLVLQSHKILLQVPDMPLNRDRWHHRGAILKSLAQLIRCRGYSEELTEISWLPSRYRVKRTLLTFVQPTLPAMLLELKQQLRQYPIFPVRVFHNNCIQPLLNTGRRTRYEREANISLGVTKDSEPLFAEGKTPPPTRPEHDTQREESTSKTQVLDNLMKDEEEMIQLFSTLTSEEQQLILNKLEIVKAMLLSAMEATETLGSLFPTTCTSVEMLLRPSPESIKFPTRNKRRRNSSGQGCKTNKQKRLTNGQCNTTPK